MAVDRAGHRDQTDRQPDGDDQGADHRGRPAPLTVVAPGGQTTGEREAATSPGHRRDNGRRHQQQAEEGDDHPRQRRQDREADHTDGEEGEPERRREHPDQGQTPDGSGAGAAGGQGNRHRLARQRPARPPGRQPGGHDGDDDGRHHGPPWHRQLDAMADGLVEPGHDEGRDGDTDRRPEHGADRADQDTPDGCRPPDLGRGGTDGAEQAVLAGSPSGHHGETGAGQQHRLEQGKQGGQVDQQGQGGPGVDRDVGSRRLDRDGDATGEDDLARFGIDEEGAGHRNRFEVEGVEPGGKGELVVEVGRVLDLTDDGDHRPRAELGRLPDRVANQPETSGHPIGHRHLGVADGPPAGHQIEQGPGHRIVRVLDPDLDPDRRPRHRHGRGLDESEPMVLVDQRRFDRVVVAQDRGPDLTGAVGPVGRGGQVEHRDEGTDADGHPDAEEADDHRVLSPFAAQQTSAPPPQETSPGHDAGTVRPAPS